MGDLAFGFVDPSSESRVDVGVQKPSKSIPLHPQVGSILSFAHGVVEMNVFLPGLECDPGFGVPFRTLDCFANHLFHPQI